MWIYEYQTWPNFTWDTDALTNLLAESRYQQGLLLGKMASLGFNLKQEANLDVLTSDVIKTSAIEGEKLNTQEVRSSIARRLGIETAGLVAASRHVDGIVELMLNATQEFTQTLTKERLFGWHNALFPTGHSGMYPITVGKWRQGETGPMQVVSGPVGRETIHFEAPAADKINHEMKVFLNWFNSDNTIDLILKAGIAHLWFVTIHPFDDGNGRIGRAISDMLLTRADNTSERFYSMSAQIESERKEYYKHLEKQQRSSPDLTEWLTWYLSCFKRALAHAEITLANVTLKARLWEHANQLSINDRQRFIINKMLEDNFKGHMNTSKYAKMTKCSNDTALRDIKVLLDASILIQNPGRGGRSTSYSINKKH